MKNALTKALLETASQSAKVFPASCAFLGVVINTVNFKRWSEMQT